MGLTPRARAWESMTDCGSWTPPREAETRADLVAKITVKAIVTDKSQSEVKARSEPRMVKNFGRVLDRKKTANADRVARRMTSAWTAVDTFPVIVISSLFTSRTVPFGMASLRSATWSFEAMNAWIRRAARFWKETPTPYQWICGALPRYRPIPLPPHLKLPVLPGQEARRLFHQMDG